MENENVSLQFSRLSHKLIVAKGFPLKTVRVERRELNYNSTP